MLRIKATYHTLLVLKNACPKLRKGIIFNFNKDLLHSNSDCFLYVLNVYIRLSDCAKEIQGPSPLACRQAHLLSSTKRVTIKRGGFLLPVLSAVFRNLASLLFLTRDK